MDFTDIREGKLERWTMKKSRIPALVWDIFMRSFEQICLFIIHIKD